MQESKRVSVPISFGEGGTIYGCGHALDTMLYAHGLATEESLFEWISDREYEAIDQILGDYDWESYTLERLNLLPTVSDEYLHGDYLRFEEPARFAQYIDEDRHRVSDAVRESIGDWTTASVPKDLIKALETMRDDIADEAQHEWLEGDRSNPGALKQLARALMGRYSDAEVSWEANTDTVTIEASEDDWRDWMSYDLGEDEAMPSAEAIGENLKDWILCRADEVRQEKTKKTLGRVAEYKRREEQKAEALERQKKEARARKAQRNQA